MKALITGITGFVAAHLADQLLDRGDRVVGTFRSSPASLGDAAPGSSYGWTRLTSPAWAAAQQRGDLQLVAWDLIRPVSDSVRQKLEAFGPDTVFHLAGISLPAVCGRQRPTPDAWTVNVDGTASAIQLAWEIADKPRFVLASSAAVYGEAPQGSPTVAENAPTLPRSGYGQTKLAAEQLVLQAVSSGRLTGVIARSFNHAGPGQRTGLMLSDWLSQIGQASPPTLRVHSLDSYFDISDVRDAARAYLAIAVRGESGQCYNVGSGTNRRSGDILAELCRLAGITPVIEETRPGNRQHPVAITTKITEKTGWQAQYALEKTLVDALYQSQGRFPPNSVP